MRDFSDDSVNSLPALQDTACNSLDPDSIPGSGRFPREGNGNPFQCSCLGSSMCRNAWQTTVHGVRRVRHNLVTKPPSPLGLMDTRCAPSLFVYWLPPGMWWRSLASVCSCTNWKIRVMWIHLTLTYWNDMWMCLA